MADEFMAEIGTGKIRGALDDGVLAFKGIPYAAAPVGALRFQPPRPAEPWPEVRDATAFGARAFQPDQAFAIAPEVREVFASAPAQPMSEDCLFLNVWTPADNSDEGDRPVMVWLHGGAFVSGSGATPWYDGTNLARKGNVVVVTLNHRLGAFGYLYLAELGGEAFARSGNAGMLDIVAALRWVRDNIASFGGDPDNVTLFGESGGGAKICVLMAMPEAQGLFHKAIVQSGPAVEMMAKDAASDTARRIVTELGLAPDQVKALLDVPAGRLLAAQWTVLSRLDPMSFANRRLQGMNPVIDGTVLLGGPFAPEAPAISARIPLLIGTNRDEMNLFFGVGSWADGLTEGNLIATVRRFLGDRAEAIVAAYRVARPQASPRELALAAATDQSIRMPSLTIAERKLGQHAAPVFVYLFAWTTPVLEGRLGACHALEIPFVFDNLDKTRLTGDAPTRGVLADMMSRSWIEFAYKDNPHHGGLPYWPAYNVAERPTMIFDLSCRVENDPLSAERKAWST